MKKWLRKAVAGLSAAAVVFGSAGVLPEGVFDGWSIGASAAEGVAIDAVNFPDENFRGYVSKNLDNGDGILSEEEIAAVQSIYISSSSVASLDGIEFFTALKYLNCANNQLTSLDVSKNTALTSLSCENNQLTSLDVSKNTALTSLSCENNQLTSLDVSNNSALTTLRCFTNQFTSLDVSKNSALKYLYCDNNQLTNLDVSNNSALVDLYCNYNLLTSLDVSNNYALEYLHCSRNQLSSLDVSNNSALLNLWCFDNQLTSLDVSNNAALKSLYCYNNQLTSLDVSKNSALVDLRCSNNQLTSLDVSKNSALEDLYCYNIQLTSLDVSNNSALTTLSCGNNQLTSLDVSNNSALTTLSCGNNQLTSLDVSQNSALTNLYCGYNKLTSLDVSNNSALTELGCYNNQLTSLDVSKNSELTYLHCSLNQLTSLDVSINSALSSLYCYNNQLTSLDVRNNPALKSLYCDYNQLTSLDVGNNSVLKTFYCSNNQLTSLDVSKTSALTFLYCYDNKLTSLDVSKNSALVDLRCSNNQLTSLDVSKNSALTNLSCGGNQFKGPELSKDREDSVYLTKIYNYGGSIILNQEWTSGGIPSTEVGIPTGTDNYIVSAYKKGDSPSFKINTLDEYCIDDVIVDGKSVGKVSEYTFDNIQEEHTLEVKFAPSKSVKSITLEKAPTKTNYIEGEKLDITGGTIKVNYDDNTSDVIAITDNMVSGYDANKIGKQKLTVTYNDKTTTFEVTVNPDPANMPVVVNGAGYDTLSAALAANKTGDLDITINKNITEAKAITIPKTNTSAKITTAKGVTLTLGTPTITANCDLVLDAAVAPAKANAKTLTIKSAADKKVTINRIETSLPLTLSGTKTTDFILNTNKSVNVLSAASVNVEIASGTTVVLNAGKFTPTTLSGAGKLNVYGASTVTIANVENADITLNQYEKTSGKNTTVLLPKFTVGTIKKMNLTVNDTAGSLADISGKTVVYLSKADAVANLENLITIANTANDKKLSAVQYKKEVRAEYLDAITVSDGSNSKNYSSLDKAFESMTNASRNYTITLNESTSASKITLPKTVASLTINGGGNTLKFVGMTSFAPKYAFSLVNITIISEDNKGNAAAFTINSSTGNTTVDGLIFSGKSLTIKGGSGNNLTLGKCSKINTLSGFKAITINAAVEIEKTLTATNLTLGSTANLKIGTGATATVKTSLTGVNGAKITLADAYKSFTLNGTVVGDKIKLVSEKSLEDKIIFKTKLDLSGKFDVSGIAPANAGTLKYDLLTNGGNAYLKAFAIDVNGTKYAFWNDAIAAITDKDTDYTITLLADVNIGAVFKLPAKGKFKSFTLNGNGYELKFVGTSVSLTGNTTFRNITISSVSKKTGEAVAWKLTVGKFDFTNENATLVECTKK